MTKWMAQRFYWQGLSGVLFGGRDYSNHAGNMWFSTTSGCSTPVSMKIADWLHLRSITPEQLRRMLGVKDRSTIHRYITGDRKPSPKVVARIGVVTAGEVLNADFENTSPPKCAIVIEGKDGEPRLVFPWSRGKQYQQAAFEKPMCPEPGPDTHSNTIVYAMEVLGGRARITLRGMFLLDGRPTDTRRLVLAANRQLASDGKPEVEYPSTPRGMK